MTKPKRRPSDTKEARRARWHKQRAAERAFLLSMGYDVDELGAFVTAWRNGKIKVTFEIIDLPKKKG